MDRFARRAVGYCADLNRSQFEANQLMQDAVLRNIELIGEAATRIPCAINSSTPIWGSTLMWCGMWCRWNCRC
ncbi:MAG: DUF86 domain-containing protein [Aphanothece saxicola GSE-SYN-MK-01-06B]|nr:DUF86 domain-containing protein [Aphanothece saxicola GSE-SYN-MK-01-06B]